MTNEERDLITRFIERVAGAPGGGGFASVPQTTPALPPVDREADQLLAELFQKYPDARYRVTQVAVVQEQALAQASQRIQALQNELQSRAQNQGTSQGQGGPSPWGNAGAQAGQGQGQSRGFFSSLFGGGASSNAPRSGYAPQPAYAPQPTYAPPPQMFQPQGSGFLGGALQTAAGVAGGVLAADALTSLFSGHHDGGFGSGTGFGGGGFGGGGFGGGGFGGGNAGWLPDSGPAPDSFGSSASFGGGPDPYDQGGALKDEPMPQQYADNASAPAQDTGWQDTSSQDNGQDSGWSDSSGGGDSGWVDSSSDS